MRTLSDSLLAEQKKATRKPVVKVEVQEYGHPLKSDSIQWTTYGWQRLYQGSEAKNFHSVTVPGDGSLCRLRLEGTNLKYSRVTNPGPGSNFNNWQGGSFGGTLANSHNAIAANGSEVIVAASGASSLYRRESSDNGASWGSWINMNNTRPCERGCAMAFKPNGDCIIVHASDINDPKSLYIQKRTNGTWSTGLGQRSGDWEIEGLAAYYDGDWNIIALVMEGNYLSIVRMVYGDGYRVTAGTWADDVKIGLGRARIDVDAQIALRQFASQWRYGGRARRTPTYWEKRQAVLEALAGESSDLAGVYLHKPSAYQALLSVARGNTPWIFRLKPGSDFYDYQWTKAVTIDAIAPYGMAIASDSSYLWATQSNEVWRSLLPSFWEPPTAGSGAGDKINIPQRDILRISESIDPEQQSELEAELNNSRGQYNSPGSGDLSVMKRGSRVNLHIGYRTTEDETQEVGQYFIESWEYNRSPNQASLTLNCVDAWGLLQRYAFNKPVEWNTDADTFSVYQLIDKLMQAVGGTLSHKSKSSLIDSLYPRLEVHAGETGASVLSRLLALVPDVIFFFGLDAYIVYPQESDQDVYPYKFPS